MRIWPSTSTWMGPLDGSAVDCRLGGFLVFGRGDVCDACPGGVGSSGDGGKATFSGAYYIISLITNPKSSPLTTSIPISPNRGGAGAVPPSTVGAYVLDRSRGTLKFPRAVSAWSVALGRRRRHHRPASCPKLLLLRPGLVLVSSALWLFSATSLARSISLSPPVPSPSFDLPRLTTSRTPLVIRPLSSAVSSSDGGGHNVDGLCNDNPYGGIISYSTVNTTLNQRDQLTVAVLVKMLGKLCVKSHQGEMSMPPAGAGKPTSRIIWRSAKVMPPPAESPSKSGHPNLARLLLKMAATYLQ